MGEEKENKNFIDGLVKDQHTVRAIQKLGRGPLEVSICRHTSTIEALAGEAALIDSALAEVRNESDKVKIEARKKQVESEMAELSKDSIDGVLTHLTYRDVNDIKAAVTEAVIHFQQYNFDNEVIMSRVIAEERFMTIFCALKRKDDITKRYFKTLDEIAIVDEMAILDMYSKWEQHFVLSDDELKN